MPLLRVADKDEPITENLTISAGIVVVSHLPNPQKTISIPGYTQTQTPIPLLGQFFVNYATGIISFNAANTGVVNVSYAARGEEIDAIYINQLIDALAAANAQIAALQAGVGEVVTGSVQTIDNVNPGRVFDYLMPANTIFVAILTFSAEVVAGGAPGQHLIAQIALLGNSFPGLETFSPRNTTLFDQNLPGYAYASSVDAGHAVLDVHGFLGGTLNWKASATILKFPII